MAENSESVPHKSEEVIAFFYIANEYYQLTFLFTKPAMKPFYYFSISVYTLLLLAQVRLSAQNALIDPGFAPSLLQSAHVRKIEVQTDHKLIALGGFFLVNNQPRLSLARLQTNGSLDTTFHLTPAIDPQTISDALLTSEGKILVSTIQHKLFRLLSDGSLDITFPPVSFNSWITSMCETLSNEYFVCGSFSQVNGQTAQRCVRIQANGMLDGGFSADTTLTKETLNIISAPNGKLYLLGFYYLNTPNPVPVVRLNADGSTDNTFQFSTGSFTVTGALPTFLHEGVVLSNGDLVVVGEDINTPSRKGVFFRIAPNGILQNLETTLFELSSVIATDDSAEQVFCSGPRIGTYYESGTTLTPIYGEKGVYDMNIAGGNLYMAGSFTSFNQIPTRSVVKLTPFGPADSTYIADMHSSAFVYSFDYFNDQIIVGGDIAMVGDTSVNNSLVFLNQDGSLNPAYQYNANKPSKIKTLQDNSVLVAESVGGGSINTKVSIFDPEGGSAGIHAYFYPTVFLRDVIEIDNVRLMIAGSFSGVGAGISGATIIRRGQLGFDPAFSNGGFWGSRASAHMLSNGKFLIGTGGGNYGGSNVNNMVRLLPDFSLDSTFIRLGALKRGLYSADVNSICVQPDGKILMAGSFDRIDNQLISPKLLRLMPDGALDTTFNVAQGFSLNGLTDDVLLQRIEVVGDLILVAGRFDAYRGVPTLRGFAVLTHDAILDTRFVGDEIISGEVWDMRVSHDSSFVTICGNFVVEGAGGHCSLAKINLQGLSPIADDVEQQQIVIYPNPVEDELTIQIARSALTEARIINTQGQLVLSMSSTFPPDASNPWKCNVSDLPPGVYFLLIRSKGEKDEYVRFVKQ